MNMIKTVNQQLHSVQAHILGTILNDVPVQRDGYYYQYYYQRYYNYYTSQDGSRTRKHQKRATAPTGVLARLKNRLDHFKGKLHG